MQQKYYDIMYEDSAIVVVNKASGISMEGGGWDDSKLRVDKQVPYPIYPIDQEASGLVVFAKDAIAHKLLSAYVDKQEVEQRYTVAVYGRPSWKENTCSLPLVPNGDKRHRAILDSYRGRKSITRFAVLGYAGNFCLLEARPITNSPHQIRAHLAALGHPVVCDSLYGRAPARGGAPGILLSSFKKNWRGDPHEEKPLINRLALHAAAIRLPSLKGMPPQLFQAPFPRDFTALITQMAKQGTFFENPLEG